MGKGNIGIILMPTRDKNSEHKTFNKCIKDGKVEMLMFGGTSWQGNESNQTFKLEIDMLTNKFSMTHLSDCQLPTNDKFIDNQHLHLNENLCEVSVIGKYGVHRINTAAPLDRLQWQRSNKVSGYDINIEAERLPEVYREITTRA